MYTSKVEIDLNCGITARLTKYGIEITERELLNGNVDILKKHYSRENKKLENIPFWEFTRIYGQYLFHGMLDIPFKDNMVTISENEK